MMRAVFGILTPLPVEKLLVSTINKKLQSIVQRTTYQQNTAYLLRLPTSWMDLNFEWSKLWPEPIS